MSGHSSSSSSLSNEGSSNSSSSRRRKQKKPNTWLHGCAGSLAGMVQKCITQPLDLIKTRMQVIGLSQAGSSGMAYSGVLSAFTSIVRQEGVLKLYTGLSPNLLGSGTAWGIYFTTYNAAKSTFGDQDLSPLHHCLCAATAGATTTLMTNPIWMVKTRMQTQLDQSASKQYRGITDAFTRIVRNEGLLTLWSGIGPALSLVSTGALQFMMYEQARKSLIDSLGGQEDAVQSWHFMAMGGLTKGIASTITYPLQVVRAKLYVPSRADASLPKPTVSQVFRQVLSAEGPLGFYRGLQPQLLKTMPSSALTFCFYETILRGLRSVAEPKQDLVC